MARQGALSRAAYLMSGDRHVAEDLVPTSLARVWSRWDHVSRVGNVDAYVHRILVNTFISVAAAARRRRWFGAAGGTSVVALAGAAIAFGLAGLSGAGAGSTLPSPSTTLASPIPTAGTTGQQTGAAAYCPRSNAGTVDWPAIDDQWFSSSTPWAGPGHGQPVPFPATQMIICRYDLKGGPVGTARVTDATTVAELQNAVNSASQRLTTNPCEIDSVTYVFFTAGTRAAFFTFDLTSCNAWMMPQSVAITGPLAGRLRSLSPDGTPTDR